MATETCEKIIEDVMQWFHSQSVEGMIRFASDIMTNKRKQVWYLFPHYGQNVILVPPGTKKKRIGGAVWVFRNSNGMFLLHSRRFFSGIGSNIDAKLMKFLWAIKNMQSFKIHHVFFALDAGDLFGVVTRSPAWPSFKFHYDQVRSSLSSISYWKIQIEDSDSDKKVVLIAKSITKKESPILCTL